MVKFDFYQPAQTPFDFSPVERGGAAMGNAYANIGQAIGAGLIQRAKLQQAQKKYDLDQNYKAALLAAAEHKTATAEAAARAKAQHDALKEWDLQQHQGVMEQQGAQRISLEDQRYKAQQDQFARTQTRLEGDSQRKQQAAAIKQAHVESMTGATSGLADEMLQRGDITDQEHALYKMQIQSGDPVMIHQVAHKMVAKSRVLDQAAIDEDLKKQGPKELIQMLTDQRKALDEAGVKIQPEEYLKARAMAVQFSRSHSKGPALAAEFKHLQEQMAGVGKQKPGSSGGPKVTTPTGRTVPDPTGLAKGGNFEDMTLPQREALTGLARKELHDTQRWPNVKDALAAAMTQKGSALDPDESAAVVEEVKRQQVLMTAQVGNEIAGMNGWAPAGQQPGQAAPAPALQNASGEDILRQEVQAGKITSDEELEKRAKELGVKLK